MENGEKTQSELETIKFHFNKSHLFRVIKIHGAWGGLSPRGEIQMNIFSERLPLPDSITQEVTDGGLGKIVEQVGTTAGIVREVEAAITMTPDVARKVAEWLTNKVEQFEALMVEQAELVTAESEDKKDDFDGE